MAASRMMLGVTAVCVLSALFVSAQTPPEPPPKFEIKIQPDAEKGPTFTVVNLSGKTLTACVLQISSSWNAEQKIRMVWDTTTQRNPPLEPGAVLVQNLAHIEGDPLPDTVEVIAGVFADGETFGQATWVKVILQNRGMFQRDYEQAAAFLQKGLDEHWTRDQYLNALDEKPKIGGAREIRLSLDVDPSARGKSLESLVQRMLANYTHDAELIRQAQPAANPPAVASESPSANAPVKP